MLALLAVAALSWAVVAMRALQTRLAFGSLADVAAPHGDLPPLTAIAAARNEAPNIEGCVRSLLAQDYPRLQVVAVDDRSTDATGAILDSLARSESRLRVVHVADLPPDWLGKNHANHVAAGTASTPWLLFTDGDVRFAPDSVGRAVSYAEAQGLSHLAVAPRMVAHGFMERAFVSGFGLFATFLFRAWELRRSGTRGFIGVGAFNLVRREAYEAVGGHRRLALEVVDDAKLGMILRRSGHRQGALDSGGLVTVRWNAGFVATVRGLEKNMFAAAEWRWDKVLVSSGGILFLSLAPLVGLLRGGEALILALPSVILGFLLHAGAARSLSGGSGLEGLAFPLSDAALALVNLWSALSATLRGGISWRGTSYELGSLRRGCVRERDWPASKAPGWGPPA